MSTTRDHQIMQLLRGKPLGDPDCQLCRGSGIAGQLRLNGTFRPCACIRRAMAQAKREAGR